MKSTIFQEQGQALVMIVLVVVIALTIGVAVSSQSLISSKQAVSEERSSQAYEAAEAGAELALHFLKDCVGGGCLQTVGPVDLGTTQYSYAITAADTLAGNIYEVKVDKDDVVQVDLSSISAVGIGAGKGYVEIYFWSPTGRDDTGDCVNETEAAIEFTYLAQEGINYLIRDKEVFDGCATRQSETNFSNPRAGGAVGGVVYSYYAAHSADAYSISLNANDIQRLLRIRTWYNSSWVAIKLHNDLAFPTQGYMITSTGISGTIKRTLKVSKSNPYLPAIFDYVLFSGGDLTK